MSGSTTMRLIPIAGLIVLGCAPACHSDRAVELDFSRSEREPVHSRSGQHVLRFGIGAMLGPEAAYHSYADMSSLLAERVGHRDEIVQSRTDGDLNRLLLDGEVDIALVCTGAYMGIRDQVRLLAVPVFHDTPTYHSLIIARRPGPSSLESLRGKRFAFTDALSNSGRLYPIYLVRQRFGLLARDFFGEIIYTGGHDASLHLVLDGLVDAAGVDSVIYEGFTRDRPQEASSLAILHRSPAFGAPPFVARKDLDPAVSDGIRDALLGLERDRAGAALLRAAGIEGFVPDADYTFAREVADNVLAPPSHGSLDGPVDSASP